MGTVSQRNLANGTLRYCAEIRINRSGFPAYKQSKMFGALRLAKRWLAKPQSEIEENPDIWMGQEDVIDLKLLRAIDKYLAEVGMIQLTLQHG